MESMQLKLSKCKGFGSVATPTLMIIIWQTTEPETGANFNFSVPHFHLQWHDLPYLSYPL